MDESADTPGSVPRRRFRRRGDGHPSTTAVADCLQRPTRVLGRAALERTLSELAPGGVYLADPVTGAAGGLLHHRFTLTAAPVRPEGRWSTVAVCSLWHCPAGHPGWPLATTLPCRSPDVPRRWLLTDATAWPTHPPPRIGQVCRVAGHAAYRACFRARSRTAPCRRRSGLDEPDRHVGCRARPRRRPWRARRGPGAAPPPRPCRAVVDHDGVEHSPTRSSAPPPRRRRRRRARRRRPCGRRPA